MTKIPDQSLTPIAFDDHAKTDYFTTQHGTPQNHVFDTTVKTNSVDQIFSLATVDFWVIAIAVLFCPNCY